MIKTNLKLAFRNILRNKLYSTINIIGLGVASAFCILVYLYVKNEQSFDNFHHDESRLFRVEETDVFASLRLDKPKKSFFSFLMRDAEEQNMIQTPTALGVDLKRNFPEIEDAVRLSGVGPETIKAGNKSFNEKDDNITYADADFFKVFNFPLISGSPSTVMSGRNQVVISQRLAKKYFGTENAVGRILLMPNESNQPPLTVSGVFKNFPANSSFQFDMILPMESNPDYQSDYERGINSFSDPLILKLKKGTDVAKFQAKLNVFAKEYFRPVTESMKKYNPKSDVDYMHIILRPFADAHYNQAPGWYHYTNLNNIYQLICITVVILFIACLNYVLLTLTSAISRSQDVGVRKTIGASRRQIVLQYYTETQLLAFIAVIVGFLFAIACLPFFGSLTGTDIELSNFSPAAILLFLFALSTVLGLLAGIYPALAMSGLKPLNIMRGFSTYRISPFLSKILVTVQFTICVIMIISTLAINKQMNFVDRANMGFDKDLILKVKSPYSWSDKQKTNVLKDELFHLAATDPAVVGVTSASSYFGGGNHNGFIINGQKVMIDALNVDYNYFTLLKIPIVRGRAFSRDVATDSLKMDYPDLQKSQKASLALRAVVVNETLYNLLGKPPVGELNRQMGGVIIGVCKDYHTDDLTKKIEPTYHIINKQVNDSYWFKIAAGKSIPREIEKIKTNFEKLTGNLPFDYTFLDQDIAKSYVAYHRWMITITTSCIIAIIIACLGLFGLSGLNTLNRTKEIGIRKVLGASVANLFVLLNRSTLWLATGSFIIAAPLAFYLVHQWLDNFAYRIKPDWLLFASAGLIAVLTVAAAVSYHTVKAATANPVNSLRNE